MSARDIEGLCERLQAWRETPFEGDPMIDALLVDVPEAAEALLALKAENDGLRASVFEECAKIAETDRRSDLAKDMDYWPEWQLNARRIAKEIRARAILRGSGEAG